MRRILAALALAAVAALVMVPASADPGNGCVIANGEQNNGLSCSYTATGAGTYVAATPNSWTISTVRDVNGQQETVVLAASISAQFPSSGAIDSRAGETITVSMGPDCVPGVVCGSIGILGAGETE